MPPGESEVTLNAHYVKPTANGVNPQTNSALPVNQQNKPPSRPPSLNNQRPRSNGSNSGARQREYNKYGPKDDERKKAQRAKLPLPQIKGTIPVTEVGAQE